MALAELVAGFQSYACTANKARRMGEYYSPSQQSHHFEYNFSFKVLVMPPLVGILYKCENSCDLTGMDPRLKTSTNEAGLDVQLL